MEGFLLLYSDDSHKYLLFSWPLTVEIATITISTDKFMLIVGYICRNGAR